MSAAGFEVRDLNRTVRRLRAFGPDLANELKDTNLELAEEVADTARDLVPRVSGTLAGSIRAAGQARTGVIRAGRASVPYANPIHWGWPRRNIRPQPFMVDALDDRRDDIEKRYLEALDTLLDRI